jgi:Ca2+-binding EF-hand superfamily protein
MIDADNSGYIDNSELGVCLKDLGYDLDDEELEEAYKCLDANGDGVIDYNEFRTWCLSGL